MNALAGVHVLVVGAGISGLSAAITARDRGARVTLIDESDRPGGMLATHTFRDVSCDLGSHRLHRAAFDDPEVAAFFARVGARERLDERPRRGVLVFGGKHFRYPPSWLHLARGLGVAGLRFAFDFLRRPARLDRWDDARCSGEDVGFASFVRARVGESAYRRFYRPYVEKVWGLDAEDVSQTVAKARVSTTKPWDLLTRRGGPASFLYPRHGLGPLVESIATLAKEAGVEFVQAQFDPDVHRADATLFSGRMRDLAPGKGLDHRGVYLLYLAFPRPRISHNETFYTPESRYWFGRVSEIANYAPALQRSGETMLCVEIPEGRWGRGVAFDAPPRLRTLMEQLREARIVPKGLDPIDVSTRFVPDVYPLYRRGWMARWEEALEEILARGVLPFGRQGLYLHCNVDACVRLGVDVVDCVEERKGREAWRERARGALGVRVRD